MITEFILTDVKNVEPIIAPSAFFHIAQFLELPSLLRLRINQADTYFDYLHLLCAPSLKTLEATNVPDHQHPTFFSFLTTLVHRAPLLEDMILGPGLFPSKSLQAILKFNNLHQLELRDAASTIDFGFLRGVGALPNLESLILDTRSCNYIARIPEEKFQTPPEGQLGNQTSDVVVPPSGVCSPYPGSPIYDVAEVKSKTPKSLSDIDTGDGFLGDVRVPSPGGLDVESSRSVSGYAFSSRPGSPMLDGISEDKEVDHPLSSTHNHVQLCDTDDSTSTGGFYQLKKFHFVGGLPLIQDLIPYIASTTLEDISLTVARLSFDDLMQDAEIEAENMRQAETKERRRKLDQETEQRIAERKKSKNFNKLQQYYLEEAEIQWKTQEAEYREIEERMKAERVQKSTTEAFELHTALYTTVLQSVSSRWSADLKTVKFNQPDGSSQVLLIQPPVLPKQVYGTLFSHCPKIETLELKRWKLDSVEDFLFSLKSSAPQNLKHLHLPDSAVSLSDLRDIAEVCPMLESLQCCIDTHYSIPATKALSHGLQTLSVANNSTPVWDFKQLLLVARHLYLTFPRLQTIDNTEGPNEEQWVHIRDLVEMFQTIREEDMNRFS